MYMYVYIWYIYGIIGREFIYVYGVCIYIGVYMVFSGREITNSTVIHGVYIRFWPTLFLSSNNSLSFVIGNSPGLRKPCTDSAQTVHTHIYKLCSFIQANTQFELRHQDFSRIGSPAQTVHTHTCVHSYKQTHRHTNTDALTCTLHDVIPFSYVQNTRGHKPRHHVTLPTEQMCAQTQAYTHKHTHTCTHMHHSSGGM
jgi:hypothetical protein